MASLDSAAIFVLLSFLIGIATAIFYVFRVMSIRVVPQDEREYGSMQPITSYGSDGRGSGPKENPIFEMAKIAEAIEEGANAFLFAEYTVIAIFIVLFGILVGVLLPNDPWATSASFVWGGVTSLICGWIGMKIAVKSNVRTTKEALMGAAAGGMGLEAREDEDAPLHYDEAQLSEGYARGFLAAFQGGAVMGFALVSLGLMNLFILIFVMDKAIKNDNEAERQKRVFEAVAGYGLGGSSMALFGRVGGGIYTKAADVGADLVGKVEAGIPEDSPKNPATIADNVGDNVGDIAGMGSDLFGSFAEATCAALVIAASAVTPDGSTLAEDDKAKWFPLAITAVGILVCMATSFIPQFWRVKTDDDIEFQLKVQLVVSTVLNTPLIYAIAVGFLPDEFTVLNVHTTNTKVFGCVAAGLWSGLIIGVVTEYFTSHSYGPVRGVADACNYGPSTNIIYGLALGYMSCVVPVLCLAITICTGYSLASQYGVAMGALGMLSTLSIGLTIDGYGPISDNAGGIAEMAECPPHIRKITDALDAAGNTTAAIGKGFAIGSAALVSLALFGAYTVRVRICDPNAPDKCNVDILAPLVFSGLVVGAMVPYAFSAMTMKSVGLAAEEMVHEVRRQFKEDFDARAPGEEFGPIMKGEKPPDYKRCVQISTRASLREMIMPAALVILTPLLVGWLFGRNALAGLLAGSLVSGVQLAISMSNTGGGWDNAKKYIEKGNLGGKGSECHKAAVIGDTVGDPLKDTSGPALNIVMKLMAILSLVFADFIRDKGGLIGDKIEGSQ